MKYAIIIILTSSFVIASSTLTKPPIEAIGTNGEVFGYVLREGVRHYEEDGKTVYYIQAKTVQEIK